MGVGPDEMATKGTKDTKPNQPKNCKRHQQRHTRHLSVDCHLSILSMAPDGGGFVYLPSGHG